MIFMSMVIVGAGENIWMVIMVIVIIKRNYN